MKKFILSTVLLSSFTIISSQAQINTRVGVKGGLNLSHNDVWVKHPLIETNNVTEFGPGFYLGGLLEISGKNKSSKLKGQVELLYNYHTFAMTRPIERTDRLQTVNIPISLKYFFKPHMSLIVGMNNNINLRVTGKEKSTGNVSEYAILNNYQAGAHVGFNYYFKKGLFLDLRYNYNFGSVFDLDNDSYYKYGHAQIGLGYKF